MPSKSNKGFTLLEVLITVAILSSAVIFIFRAFGAVLNSAKFSQNISSACYLAENKIWEIRHRRAAPPKKETAAEEYSTKQRFNWRWENGDLENLGLSLLKFNVSWKERMREKDYEISLSSYLLKSP